MGPRSADFKLNHRLPCSASPLPICSAFRLLPAPPGVLSLVPGELGFVPFAHGGLPLGMCLFIHTVISSCPAAPGTRRDTFTGLPQPALRRAAQALRVMVLPVSCLLHSTYLPGLISPGRPRLGDWGCSILALLGSALLQWTEAAGWRAGRPGNLCGRSAGPLSRQNLSRVGVIPVQMDRGLLTVQGSGDAARQLLHSPEPTSCHCVRGSSPLPVPGSTSTLLPVSFQKPTSFTDK